MKLEVSFLNNYGIYCKNLVAFGIRFSKKCQFLKLKEVLKCQVVLKTNCHHRHHQSHNNEETNKATDSSDYQKNKSCTLFTFFLKQSFLCSNLKKESEESDFEPKFSQRFRLGIENFSFCQILV